MNVLTLKIPEGLDAALLAASRSRGLSKSAMVREAIEQSLGRHEEQAGTADRWLTQWRGCLLATQTPAKMQPKAPKVKAQDDRLAHLLAKHLR
jgi:predicted transcriptional regulator